MTQEYLSALDIARRLKISPSAVKIWIRRKGLPATKSGNGRWQISAQDFAEFYHKNRERPGLRGHFCPHKHTDIGSESGDTLSSKQVAQLFGLTKDAVNYWFRHNLLKGQKQPNGYWRVTREELEQFLTSYNRTEQPEHILYIGGNLLPDAIHEIAKAFNCKFTSIVSEHDLSSLLPPGATLLLVEQEDRRAREYITAFRRLKGAKRTPITLLSKTLLDEDWLEFATKSKISGVIECALADVRLEIQRHLAQKKFPAFGKAVKRKYRLRAKRANLS